MFNFKSLVKRRSKAIAFIDYDYWFYSYNNLFQSKPDLKYWKESLPAEYMVDEILVFGDFSSRQLSDELEKARRITKTVIETSDSSIGNKKGTTEFVMLNYIYQCMDERKDIDTYILFAGDGRFESLVNYLVLKKRFKVLLYGVMGSVSRRLQTAATRFICLPTDGEKMRMYYKMIIEDMNYVSDKSKIIPTFWSTIDAVSQKNNVPYDEVRCALTKMISDGYILQKERHLSLTKSVRIVYANWELLIRDGLWTP